MNQLLYIQNYIQGLIIFNAIDDEQRPLQIQRKKTTTKPFTLILPQCRKQVCRIQQTLLMSYQISTEDITCVQDKTGALFLMQGVIILIILRGIVKRNTHLALMYCVYYDIFRYISDIQLIQYFFSDVITGVTDYLCFTSNVATRQREASHLDCLTFKTFQTYYQPIENVRSLGQ